MSKYFLDISDNINKIKKNKNTLTFYDLQSFYFSVLIIFQKNKKIPYFFKLFKNMHKFFGNKIKDLILNFLLIFYKVLIHQNFHLIPNKPD